MGRGLKKAEIEVQQNVWKSIFSHQKNEYSQHPVFVLIKDVKTENRKYHSFLFAELLWNAIDHNQDQNNFERALILRMYNWNLDCFDNVFLKNWNSLGSLKIPFLKNRKDSSFLRVFFPIQPLKDYYFTWNAINNYLWTSQTK